MEDLPRIPGYAFPAFSDENYKIKQKLHNYNGCRVIRDLNIGIGRRPIDAATSAYAQEMPQVMYDPYLTYGRPKKYPYRQVIPHYVLYAQKCLNFKAFFCQKIFNSPSEQQRTRHVNIIYFLEDDTMTIIEPPVDNAGFKQGKLVKRSKIPKVNGDFYLWKDLNVGIDMMIYGVNYHTVDCDLFTKEFLTSQGIDVNGKELPPSDSYIQDRVDKLTATQIASSACKRAHSAPTDALGRFLRYDGIILTFYASWNDDLYQILYFLTDNTIAVKEMPGPNSGKDPVRMLLKRTKIPKNWSEMSQTFPSIYLERSDEDVDEYYSPLDLKLGETIAIFNRQFFLYDCDQFTRNYYKNTLNINQPPRISLQLSATDKYSNEILAAKLKGQKRRTNKDDVIRKLINYPKKLRYLASMVAIRPEDNGRDFVIEYSLADGKIKICEIHKRNSGHRSGCFLTSMNIPKPRNYLTRPRTAVDDFTEDDDDILYYTPEDFFIGAHINVFNHRFIIKGADLFVWRYINANTDKFSPELIENMHNYFSEKGDVEKSNKIMPNDKAENFNKTEPTFPVEKKCDVQEITSQLPIDGKGDLTNNFDYNNDENDGNRQIS